MAQAKKTRVSIHRLDRETPTLVAVVTRKKDWRILKQEHWYRIPVRTAPGGLEHVQWLAFYQTKVFGVEKWAINYCAGVTGIRTMPRIELLPDEPLSARAHDLYYRLETSELNKLERPIPSLRWRRVVFISTTLERLLRAREINDLFCTSPIEDNLYQRMKAAGLMPERQFPVREQESGHMLDLAVFCRDGGIDVECDGEAYHSGRDRAEADRARDNALTCAGWRILRFSGREIRFRPEACLRTVRRAVKRLGGEMKPYRPV